MYTSLVVLNHSRTWYSGKFCPITGKNYHLLYILPSMAFVMWCLWGTVYSWSPRTRVGVVPFPGLWLGLLWRKGVHLACSDVSKVEHQLHRAVAPHAWVQVV